MPNHWMTRCFTTAILLALIGCSNSSAPSGAQSGVTGSAVQSNAPAAAPPIVVPPGTVIVVTLDQTVSTKTSNVGDSFAATVAAPVIVDGSETIPKGAKAAGHITTADQAGRVKGGSRLVLDLDSITVHGAPAQIHTAAVAEAGKS